MELKIKAWSPSRLGKWKECPAKVKYEDLLKLCPVCKRGKISGGFDGQPVQCDTCDGPQPEREALDRGNRLDAALTLHVAGPPVSKGPVTPEQTAHVETLVEAVRHPVVAAMVKKLRKAKGVFTQHRIAIDRNWKQLHEDPSRGIWPRGVWGRVVLDVLQLTPKVAKITDWKSGNIDKKTNEIRERAEYHDSMRIYQAAVLSTHPQAEATAQMVFLDAPPKLVDPTKQMEPMKRKNLDAAKADIERKLLPMMSDTVFAPRPGYYCSWCPFSKDKGGPCEMSGQSR